MVGQPIREKCFNGSRLRNESQKHPIYSSLQQNEGMHSSRKFCFNPYSNLRKSSIPLNKRVGLESLFKRGSMHGSLRTLEEKNLFPFSKDFAPEPPFRNTLQFRRTNLHGLLKASDSSINYGNSNPQYDQVSDFSSQGYVEGNRYNNSRTPSLQKESTDRYSFQRKKTLDNQYPDTNQATEMNPYQFYQQNYNQENGQYNNQSDGKVTDLNTMAQGYENAAPYTNQYSYANKEASEGADVYNTQGNEATNAYVTQEAQGDQPVETDIENEGYQNVNDYAANGEYQYNTGNKESYVDPNTYGYEEPYVDPNTYGYQEPYADPNTYGYQEPYVDPNTYGYQEPYVDPNTYGYQESYAQPTAYDASRKSTYKRTSAYPNQYPSQQYYNAPLRNARTLHQEKKTPPVYSRYESYYPRQNTSNTQRISYKNSEDNFLDVTNEANSMSNDRNSNTLVRSSKVRDNNDSYKKQDTLYSKNNVARNRQDLKKKNNVIRDISNLIQGREEKNGVLLTLNDENGKPLQIQLRALTKKSQKSSDKSSSSSSSSDTTCSDENTEIRNTKSHGKRSRRRNREVVIEALIPRKNKTCSGTQCKHNCQKICCHNAYMRHNTHSKCHNSHSKKPIECTCNCKRINGQDRTYLVTDESNTGSIQKITVKREKSPVVNLKAPSACIPYDESVRQKLRVEEITPNSCRCNDKEPTSSICPLVVNEGSAFHSLNNWCNLRDTNKQLLTKVGEKIFEVIPISPYNVQPKKSQECPHCIVTPKTNSEPYTKLQGWFPCFRRTRPARALHRRFLVKNISPGALRKLPVHMV
jgi:hypothetical protein